MLVDTGLHPSVAAKPRENMGRTSARFARPRDRARPRPAGSASRTRDRGPGPSTGRDDPPPPGPRLGDVRVPQLDVRDLRRGVARATTDPRPLLRGYRPAHYDYVFDYRTVSYEGPGITSYSTFGRSFDLFGDGSVRLAFTPGHSAGHQSVIAHLRNRDFVIAGDAIYTHGQLGERTGAAAPPRPSHVAALPPGAGAVRAPVPPGRDRPRARPRALADAGREVRLSGVRPAGLSEAGPPGPGAPWWRRSPRAGP